ncbi:MAG TPA: zinc ribbon domain-containing protein [Tepidisphaeraceae bacterium]
MGRFNPTIRAFEGNKEQPDLLAGAILNSLTRPIYRPLSMNLLKSFLVTVFTLGILPVLLMAHWLRGFIATQEQQLWHLAEWMRVQTGEADASELQKAVQRIRFNAALGTITVVFTLGALAIALKLLAIPGSDLRSVFHAIYHPPTTPEAQSFALALSVAAVCHLAHLAWHQHNVEGYIRWFNRLALRHNLAEVRPPEMEFGIRPGWIIAGLVLAVSGGAIWALPVMLAAGAHRRYIMRGSVGLRAMLADRMRTMLAHRRPAMRVPQPVMPVAVCIRPNCQAPLPAEANFCPRCGTTVAQRQANVVA